VQEAFDADAGQTLAKVIVSELHQMHRTIIYLDREKPRGGLSSCSRIPASNRSNKHFLNGGILSSGSSNDEGSVG